MTDFPEDRNGKEAWAAAATHLDPADPVKRRVCPQCYKGLADARPPRAISNPQCARPRVALLFLHTATGDSFFEQVAFEVATFIGNYQMHAPRQPWHGGMNHALGQYCGKHWGPDLAGQVDTGMATGNGLAAVELWLAHEAMLNVVDTA